MVCHVPAKKIADEPLKHEETPTTTCLLNPSPVTTQCFFSEITGRRIMIHQLPTELSVYIIQTAAHQYRFSDRQSVVNLAMSSRAIYDIVCPILYHTLIVTDRNAGQLGSLASNIETHPLAKRLFLHVHSYYNFSQKGQPVDISLLVNVETVEWYLAALEPFTKLKSVHLRQLNFKDAVSRFARSGGLRAVTHTAGTLPIIVNDSTWNDFFADPAAWMQSLLDSLPALTHLGLLHEFPWRGYNDNSQSYLLFDCGAIGTAVRTALRDYPRLRCIVIRTGKLFAAARRTELEKVLRDLHDPRVKVWFDERPVSNHKDFFMLRALDVEEGRSLWTEAHSL